MENTPRSFHIEKCKQRNYTNCFFDAGCITEGDYPFTIKPNFSTLGSIIEIEPARIWQISFVEDDTL